MKLTQKGKDLRRVIASVSAYAVIGTLIAVGLWATLSIVVNVAKDYS